MDALIERMEQFRSLYYKADKKVLEKYKVYASLDELEKELSSGCFRIDIKGARWECLFHKNTASPKKLYVFLCGAGKPISLLNRPMFVRWSYHTLVENESEGFVLCVFDPMRYKYPDLNLGWYYGSEEQALLVQLCDLIKAVCSTYSLRNEDVVFMGSSGGGYAALYSASIMDGSMAVAINPQIYIQNYVYAKYFEKITGLNLNKYDPLQRNNLAYMMKKSNSRFCVINNIQDEHDIEYHLKPLCNEYGLRLENTSYGLTPKDNMLLWLYSAKGLPHSHNSVENKSIFCAIDYIAKEFGKGRIDNKHKKIALFVNEYWHELYEERFKVFEAVSKEHKNHFVVYLPEVPCVLSSNDIVDEVASVRVESSGETHGRYGYSNFSDNKLYTLQLYLEADYPQCSIGLWDQYTHKTVHMGTFPTKETIRYSFIVGDNAEGLYFVVHASRSSRDKGKPLLIKNLKVMARPLSEIAKAGSESHLPGDIYWYDECLKSLSENEWTKGSNVALYDHHALPWRQIVELQKLLRERKPAAVLELGLGESSKLIAQYAAHTGANHVIIDADPQYSRAFLQKNPDIFARTKVHISPLLNAQKDKQKYCCFQNFRKIVGNSKFGLIIQHCSRGGHSDTPYVDVGIQLHELLEDEPVILMENADNTKVRVYIDDITELIQKHGGSAEKRYIALPQGECCLILTRKN